MINNENFIFLILSILCLVVIYTKRMNKKQKRRVKFKTEPKIYYIKSLKDYDLWWK